MEQYQLPSTSYRRPVILRSSIARRDRKGLFRGHPAKPYYEAMDGVGYLLYALLQLDQIQKDPKAAVAKKAIVLENDNGQTTMSLENW